MTPKKLTDNLLKKCEVAGITKVAIGVRHSSVRESLNYPFGFIAENVFTNKPNKKYTFPPIWEILKDMKLSYGCGNGHQHQAHTKRLVMGVYHFKNNKWEKVDES